MIIQFNKEVESTNIIPLYIKYNGSDKYVVWKCKLCDNHKMTRYDYFKKMVKTRIEISKIFCDKCVNNLIKENDIIYDITVSKVNDTLNESHRHIDVDYICKCGNTGNMRVRYILHELYIRKSKKLSCGRCGFKLTNNVHYSRAKMILSRCNDISHKSFNEYGGRGIKCILGKDVVDVIRSIELIPGYQEGLQLDRVNNNGHYTIHHPIHGDKVWIDNYGHKCLGNLRWVTPSMNSSNRRNSVDLNSLASIPRSQCLFRKIINKEHMRILGLNKFEDYHREFHFIRNKKQMYTYRHKTLLNED